MSPAKPFSTPRDLLLAGQAETLDASAEGVPGAEAQISPRLGRFVLLRTLGKGGMGSVFAAYDEQLDRKVALKLLHQVESTADGKRQRVLREAQAMARVSHPNVVHVYDVGEAGGRIFIAMEYVEGGTLTRWQEHEPRTWQQTLSMYRQAGQGLLAAHQAGLVHRDFKPDNVLIDKDERARVADFGLARMEGGVPTRPPTAGAGESEASGSGSGTPLTLAGTIAGTPGYMSPEQYRGESTDSRSDQFSFCVALYEALYQRLPFAGETIAEQAANVLAGKLLPSPYSSPVPAAVYGTLLRGLAVAPADRFPSMAELLGALEPDAEPDPTAGAATRQQVTRIFFISCMLAVGFIVARYWRSEITIAGLIFIAALTVCGALFFGVLFRRTFFAHAFNRRLSNGSLVLLSTWLGIRCLALPLHLTVRQLMPIEMLVLGGFYAGVAAESLPKLWVLVGSLVAGAIVSTVHPPYTETLFLMIYSAWPLVFLYAWESAGRRRRARTGAKHRHPSASTTGSSPAIP